MPLLLLLVDIAQFIDNETYSMAKIRSFIKISVILKHDNGSLNMSEQ